MKRKKLIIVISCVVAIGLIVFGRNMKNNDGYSLQYDYEIKAAVEDVLHLSFGKKAVESFRKDYSDENVTYCIGGIYDEHKVYVVLFKEISEGVYQDVFSCTTNKAIMFIDEKNHLFMAAGLYDDGPTLLNVTLNYNDGSQKIEKRDINKFILEFFFDPEIKSVEFEEGIIHQTVKL